MRLPRPAVVALAALPVAAGAALGTHALLAHHDHAQQRAAVHRAVDAVLATLPDAPLDPPAGLDELARLVVAEPQGDAPEVARRFLDAVQRGADLEAAQELVLGERARLAHAGRPALAHVIDDVRRHAGLDGSSPCLHAEQYGADAVLVSCGAAVVVVSAIRADLGSGVEVFSGPAEDPTPRGHRYAYSTVEV